MRTRLPDTRSILQVYGVIAVMFAGWTILAFLWKLSAWLLLLNLGEIFTIFSYAMAANFLESLLLLAILLAACALLPARILRDHFTVRGTILSVGLVAALMAFVGVEMWAEIRSSPGLLIVPVCVLLLTAVVLRLSSRLRVSSAALWLSDRVTVFLFLLLPLFVILSAYVIVRNIS